MTELILVIVGAMVLFVALLMPRLRGKRPREGSFTPRTDYAAQARVQRSMEDLLLEIEEVSREINARIGTKMQVLNQLIQDADERIAALREGGGRESVPVEDPSEIPPEQQRIYDLADRGLSRVAIAREAGMERGEVDLILSMRGGAGGGRL